MARYLDQALPQSLNRWFFCKQVLRFTQPFFLTVVYPSLTLFIVHNVKNLGMA